MSRAAMLPGAAALVALVVLAVWLLGAGAPEVQPRVPTPGEPRGGQALTAEDNPNPGTLRPGEAEASSLPGSWPQFRGGQRDGIARGVQLARRWPPEGPRVLWRLPVGEGHAGPAVHGGCVFLVDYDQERREDAIRCLSLADGDEVWRYTYHVRVKRNHGMSRTVPAVNDDFVVALGPKCHVHCLRAADGEMVWRRDLVLEHGSEVPPWYAGQCPLIDGPVVILAPGGDPLMMAVDLATGEERWRTPNPGGWGMTHSSVVPFDHPTGRQYVYCATLGVVGISAVDGSILWQRTDWRIQLATVPSPVVVGSDRIFLSGGYEAGCMMMRVAEDLSTEVLWRQEHTTFGSDQQTPVLWEEHLYGVAPGGELACLDLEGELRWRSGVGNRFGLGPYLLADGLLLVLADQEGTLTMAPANPRDYQQLAHARVLQGHDAWGPMALVGHRLLVRDLTELVCLELPGP